MQKRQEENQSLDSYSKKRAPPHIKIGKRIFT